MTTSAEHFSAKNTAAQRTATGDIATSTHVTGGERVTYQPNSTVTVDRPVMVQNWNLLTFLHWSFEPSVVQKLLPPGLEVHTYDGKAWVGLVPFTMVVRGGRGPTVPWLSRFPETNVRTYVTAPDGTNGVWFFSLEAARLPAVVTARTGYRLPYFWAEMSLEQTGDVYTYESRRRWPGPGGTRSRTVVRVGDAYQAEELGDFDHFLTARFRLYSHARNGLRYALADHPPWDLRRAELLELDDQLIVAAGLPVPTGDPVVHWSAGTEVQIGLPHRLQAGSPTANQVAVG